MGIRSDYKRYRYEYYGGYCNKVKNLNLEPIFFVNFQMQ